MKNMYIWSYTYEEYDTYGLIKKNDSYKNLQMCRGTDSRADFMITYKKLVFIFCILAILNLEIFFKSYTYLYSWKKYVFWAHFLKKLTELLKNISIY